METHATATFYRGDDWPIEAALHAHDWTALDVSDPSCVIEWELKSATGTVVLTISDATLELLDASHGKIRITVPKAKTATVPVGSYTDVCRVTTPALRSTQFGGGIDVKDLF